MLARLFGFGDNNTPDASQSGAPQPSFLQRNPGINDLLTVASLGLLAKGQNRQTDITPLFAKLPEMAKDREKQTALQALQQDMMKSPYLQDDATRGMVRDLVAAGMPDKAFDYIKSLGENKSSFGAPIAVQDKAGKTKYVQVDKNGQIRNLDEIMPIPRISGAGSAGLNSVNALKSQIAHEYPEFNEDQIDQATSAVLSGYQKLPDGTALKPMSGLVKELANQVIKQGGTAGGIDQSRYALTFDNIWKSGLELAPQALKYSGALGEGQLRLDRIKSAFGKGTPEYKAYIKFTRVTAPALANAAIKAEASNMTDTGKDMMIRSVSPAAFDTDFDTAMAAYNYIGQLYSGSISPAAISSVSEVRQKVKENEAAVAAQNNNQQAKPTQQAAPQYAQSELQQMRDEAIASGRDRKAAYDLYYQLGGK